MVMVELLFMGGAALESKNSISVIFRVKIKTDTNVFHFKQCACSSMSMS